ncbi:IS66 family insertion sequence element accessory protein TnpA [Lactiplantibacillus plantarum]|uniref:IS66 family insertion sequence element accessory protein TnpA n=1 Tax=Lactiplantibacillus plantarum TaxID=1590 RepID=UPI00226E0D10|nr:helix-turn-helix domain-containing protein [Lactiplantibacillus plantarum]MDO7794864.1 helix-turn-helix domain-containing protein [Lactiplantibacillus plantarum]
MPRSRYTLAEKLALITELQSSSLSITAFSKQHGLDYHTIGQWELRLQRDSINGLIAITKNQHYSKAFKQMIIHAYLNGEGTLQELTNKYQMRSTSQLRNWLIKQTVTASPSRKQVPKMSRKTTFNERVEIVEWINKGNHSYSEAAEHFNVSYQQARSWALKAQAKGFEALVDNRGYRKPESELTDLDKANLRIRQLESQIKDQQLLEAFIKKYQELQRKG